MSHFDFLIKSLGEASGIDDMRPDEQDGAVHLVFDDDLTVFIQPNAEQTHLTLYAAVGLVDETVAPEVLVDLLSASLFGRGANGASFALEDSMGQIVLQRSERIEGLEYADFEQQLQQFIDSAEAWKQRLSPATDGLGEATPLADEGAAPTGQIRV